MQGVYEGVRGVYLLYFIQYIFKNCYIILWRVWRAARSVRCILFEFNFLLPKYLKMTGWRWPNVYLWPIPHLCKRSFLTQAAIPHYVAQPRLPIDYLAASTLLAPPPPRPPINVVNILTVARCKLINVPEIFMTNNSENVVLYGWQRIRRHSVRDDVSAKVCVYAAKVRILWLRPKLFFWPNLSAEGSCKSEAADQSLLRPAVSSRARQCWHRCTQYLEKTSAFTSQKLLRH